MSFNGKVALVTGAGSGIGKSSAVLLAAQGAKIGCLGRTESQLQEVVDAIKATGGDAIVLRADVSISEQMQRSVEQLAEEWGGIDIVVANAGINGVWAPLEELTAEEWDTTLDINLKGSFLTVKYALPYLKENGGSIVVISSILGTRVFGIAGTTAYGSSKAAQLAFAKMIALELAPYRIRVNVVCPGWITTEIEDNTFERNLDAITYPIEYPKGIVPLTDGQPASPDKVAELISFLASDAADHITGSEVYIDGAQSLIQG